LKTYSSWFITVKFVTVGTSVKGKFFTKNGKEAKVSPCALKNRTRRSPTNKRDIWDMGLRVWKLSKNSDRTFHGMLTPWMD
jgi:hypothetical protein